ncbi:MAG TPA: DNA polymerase I [Syntrophobacteria bacterium]|nr:DNA polymerase I [Syntrophobacteria bacterium]
MVGSEQALYLIDGSSYIYRAFYAVKDLSTSGGLPTNGVYGFLGMLRRVLKEKRPTYLAVALDAPGPTFRHQLSAEYKATRPQMPEPLARQLPYIKRLIALHGIPLLEVNGVEADDIIGTLTAWASGQGRQVVIVSGDKDLLQLVSSRVCLWDTMKDVVLGPQEVEQRYGVPPSQLVEVMGLAGDSSDNIPGVPGIGPKTAARLIREFGSIENLLAHLPEVPSARERSKLEGYAAQARLSRELVTLNCRVSLEPGWERLRIGTDDREALAALFRELEFRRFLQELEGEGAITEGSRPLIDAEIIRSAEELKALLTRLAGIPEIGVKVISSGGHPMAAELLGVALAWGPENAGYVPLGQGSGDGGPRLERKEALEALAPLFRDQTVGKVSHNSKLTLLALKRYGIELAGLRFDPMLAAYLLDPEQRVQLLSVLAKEYLGETLVTGEDLVGSGRDQRPLSSLGPAEVAPVAAGEAACSLRLAPLLRAKLEAEQLTSLFHTLELPLVRVLAWMEFSGVRVDVAALERLSAELDQGLEASSNQIYRLAGGPFNINSPQQLGTVLFEKLALPVIKKTKTGYSTDMEVLTGLAPLHPLPAELLRYRSLMKLKNTYTDTLPRLVNPQTGRIHTSYNQTGTVTGRLSSSEPNLQNIPVRTEEGRVIRRAFVAEPGFHLLAADYSQIELRILAHYSRDETLMAGFQKDEDIHLRTAAEVFGVDAKAVTPEMRRQAKTINFGIIYGMSPFGLARELGIPQAVARAFIQRYFDRYPGVRAYVEQMPLRAREQGYVTTLFQRRRVLPDISSRNRNLRQFAERTAINTPIQGSAADMMKLAMIQIDSALKEKGLPATMIMQIHDELVFEVEREAVPEVAALVRQRMESVGPLGVPLRVAVGHGQNWDEAH